MSYRNFKEVELKAVQRFSIEMYRRYKVEMTNWKIEDNGNLTIKLNYDTAQYHFDDTVYILQKNRMNLKNVIVDFRKSCDDHLANLSDPFGYDVNEDYDMYR